MFSSLRYKLYVFSQVDNDPQLVDHGKLMENISQTQSGDNSPLCECNIHPTQNKSKHVLLYKQHCNILLKQGLLSIGSRFSKSGCCLKKYFVQNQKCLTYHGVRSQIVFHKTAKEGSNAASCQENAITEELKLYLVLFEHGENGVFLKDYLRVVTATDQIPVFGIRQKKCF